MASRHSLVILCRVAEVYVIVVFSAKQCIQQLQCVYSAHVRFSERVFCVVICILEHQV